LPYLIQAIDDLCLTSLTGALDEKPFWPLGLKGELGGFCLLSRNMRWIAQRFLALTLHSNCTERLLKKTKRDKAKRAQLLVPQGPFIFRTSLIATNI
jgi:hypothetical protein